MSTSLGSQTHCHCLRLDSPASQTHRETAVIVWVSVHNVKLDNPATQAHRDVAVTENPATQAHRDAAVTVQDLRTLPHKAHRDVAVRV